MRRTAGRSDSLHVDAEDFLHDHQGRTFGAPGLMARTGYASRREQPRGVERPGMTWVERLGSAGLAVVGRRLRRVLRTQALRRGGCRALLPRHRPQPALAATSGCRGARDGQIVRYRARYASRRAKRSAHLGQNAAHCPCLPLHLQGQPKILSSHSAKTALQESIFGTHPCARRPNAGPAGLTARARPEARPDGHAANLRPRRRA
jgi:hypothetical protein